MAAEALGWRRAGVKALRTALASDRNSGVRSAAAGALRRHGDIELVPFLIDRYGEEPSTKVRTSILDAIGKLGGPEAIRWLTAMLTHAVGATDGIALLDTAVWAGVKVNPSLGMRIIQADQKADFMQWIAPT